MNSLWVGTNWETSLTIISWAFEMNPGTELFVDLHMEKKINYCITLQEWPLSLLVRLFAIVCGTQLQQQENKHSNPNCERVDVLLNLNSTVRVEYPWPLPWKFSSANKMTCCWEIATLKMRLTLDSMSLDVIILFPHTLPSKFLQAFWFISLI